MLERRARQPRLGRGTIVIAADLCKGCEVCVAVCPEPAVVAMSERLNAAGYRLPELVNEAGCTGCSFCARMCPDVAITVYLRDRAPAGMAS